MKRQHQSEKEFQNRKKKKHNFSVEIEKHNKFEMKTRTSNLARYEIYINIYIFYHVYHLRYAMQNQTNEWNQQQQQQQQQQKIHWNRINWYNVHIL